MPLSRLLGELAALDVELILVRDERQRLILQVWRTETEARLAAAILARHPKAEPLPQLLAKLVRGEISADTAGAAIARDPALAGQVAAATGPVVDFGQETQAGDVGMGDVAGRDVIKVYIGSSG